MKKTLLSLTCLLFLLAGKVHSQTCNPVYAMGFTTPTSNTDTVTWTVYSNPMVAGAEYLLNTTAAAPSGSGTFTTDTFYYATGLTPNTTYYFHLRFKCTNNAYSQWWTGPAFVTAPPTAVADISGERGVSLFPNPATSYLNIVLAQDQSGHCVIYDVAGKALRQVELKTSDSRIDVQDLAPGVYHVSVRTAASEYHMRFVRL